MSFKIDISNYEEFVMDYLEGNLQGDFLAHFEAFLLKNPEVVFELDELKASGYSLEKPDQIFDSSSLKVEVKTVGNINESNYEEQFVLSENRDEILAFVSKNPLLKRDFDLYEKSKFEPNLNIVFDGKSELKQPIPLWQQWPANAYRIAAVLVIALGAVTLLRSVNEKVYSPRTEETHFAQLDFESKGEVKTSTEKSNAEVKTTNNNQPQFANEPKREMIVMIPSRVEKRMEVADLANRTNEMEFVIEPEELAEVVAVSTPSKTQPMSIAQYVGRQFLGVDPANVPTAKALIKEGAKKAINKSDQIAIQSEESDNQKKIFQLRTGFFQFKRVTYAAN